MSKKAAFRLQRIVSAIEDIAYIMTSNEVTVTQAIENRLVKPAIRMHIIRIAEQFEKLQHDNDAASLLSAFSERDVKGIPAVRNYIAHEYDSTDDHIIEDVIRYNLPELKRICQSLLKTL